MAGILIPVVVHLWNDRRGKVLRIGSIAMLTGSSRRLAWSRRLTQRVLLALRCLLVTALALLLAGPYWTQQVGGKKGWVLVDPAVGGEAAARERGGIARCRLVVDSLVKAGYERHVLDSSGNYWDAFRRADRVAPAGMLFYVFTTGLADRFAGERPVTGREVHWEVYTPVDSVSQWVAAAWRMADDSIMVLTGNSRSTGTEWKMTPIRSRAGQYEGVKVDTAVLSVVIYMDESYKHDGKYLTAALKALSAVTHRRMRVAEASGRGVSGLASGRMFADSAGGDWLFWLSSRPLPPVVGFAHAWGYAQGRMEIVDTYMEGTPLTKEIAGAGEGGVWKDGYGRGVLTRDGRNYRYFSRLDPAWSDLAWNGRLPVLLGELMMERRDAGEKDRRVLDPGQVAPGASGSGASGRMSMAAGGMETVDLKPVAWLIVFILFFLERIKAFTNGGRKA